MFPLNGGALRHQLPSSRMRVFSRITLFDTAWAAVSPVLAFIIRDGVIIHLDDVVIYSSVALIISVIVFQWFRISSPLPNFFSSHDAVTIAKASAIIVALTAVVLFTLTRLNQAPRSIPIIHVLVLASGLTVARAWNRLASMRTAPAGYQLPGEEMEAVIVVGATRLAWFYSMMVDELSSQQRRIVGVVDERPQLLNRTLNGHSIVGLPKDLPKIIDEYASHGVEVRKIAVAANPNDLTEDTRQNIRTVCQGRGIPIDWLHETFVGSLQEAPRSGAPSGDLARAAAVRPYWKIKRPIDILVAVAMMITLAPLTILVAVLVMIDVGFPVVFWQQRIGRYGRSFHLYKFRAMRSRFSRKGQPIPESERLSVLGRLLRWNHVDEIPQLFNILTGDMSLVGPRPLLQVDQPDNAAIRLQVRPGLTGLAQINGGTSLSANEKNALDEWYIEHASLWLDLKIMLRTVWVTIRGNPRNDKLISHILAERHEGTGAVFAPPRSTVKKNDKASEELKDILAVRRVSSKY